MPPEVEQAIDKRSSMAAIGNLNDFVKYQMGKGLEAGSGGAGAAGTAAELAVGFGLAQQMMREGFMGGHATPTVPPVPTAGAAARRLPELLSPAEAAQALGVSEADVMAVLESGDLKGKKIGADVADLARRAHQLHGAVAPMQTQIACTCDCSAVSVRMRIRASFGAREARVPGLRRAGRVESRRKQKLVVPLLRHGIAVPVSIATPARSSRSTS